MLDPTSHVMRAVRNGNSATSALSEHTHSTGHPINWAEAVFTPSEDVASYLSSTPHPVSHTTKEGSSELPKRLA